MSDVPHGGGDKKFYSNNNESPNAQVANKMPNTAQQQTPSVEPEDTHETMYTATNPLTPAAVNNPYLSQLAKNHLPSTNFSGINYAQPAPTMSIGKRARKSLWAALLAYLPLKWIGKKVGFRGPSFLALAAGLFGYHSLKHVFAPATVPIHNRRLNITG